MNDTIKWYRVPLDKEKLKLLSQRSDLMGFKQSLSHLILWAITGTTSYYFFKIAFWEGFVISLLLHGLIGSHFLHAHHELSHGTVFKTKYLNLLFLKIFSLLGFLNYHVYIMSHGQHHKKTCFTDGDREVVLPRKPSINLIFLIQLFTINIFSKGGLIHTLKHFINISTNQFDKPFNSWDKELFSGKPKEREKAKNWARFVLTFHTMVLLISSIIGDPIISVLISLHVFIFRWHHYFLNETQHTGLQSNINDFRKNTRSIRINPISEFLYWHMNWHIEHHMYTSVPCYNLKKLHHSISHHIPLPRTVLEAWLEMRETWKLQIEDTKYFYDTPSTKII